MTWDGIDHTEFQRVKERADMEMQAIEDDAVAFIKNYRDGMTRYMSQENIAQYAYKFAACLLTLTSVHRTLSTAIEIIAKPKDNEYERI